MQVLENLKYTQNHEWVLIKDNIVTVGITDFAQAELGDIVYVDVDTMGTSLNIDDVFGSVEAVKTVSDLFMPLKGEVIEVNHLLENNPELVNESPYKDGWIIKVKVEQLNDKLLTAQEYKNHIGI